jgi:hypothetical protein
MKRRAFLVGLAAAPWFIRRAFGDASIGGAPVGGGGPLTLKGPTLVLVVPRGDGPRWDRGTAFGALLNHGSDAELAPLAAVDLVCAPASALGVAGEPLLIHWDGTSVRASVSGKLPQYGKHAEFGDPKEAAISAERIAFLARLVRSALPMPAGLSIPDAAAQVRARYVKKPPRGSRWGRASGCGTYYENDARSRAEMPDCGMGHVPEASARFLDFLVKT